MSNHPSNPASSSRTSYDRRTSSFSGLLKRSKSNDLLGERKPSSSNLLKRAETGQEEALRPQEIVQPPPKLPGLPQQPEIQTFGGEDYRPTMAATDTLPVPPIPAGFGNGAVDPYARTESMAHRGRHSYARSTNSTLNNPRRARRRRDPTPYNVLIVGARNSGKTSFLNFLKSSLAPPHDKQSPASPEIEHPPISAKQNRSFTHHYQETEIENELIGLTLWDSPGLEKNVVDLQLREMSNFVESKFDDTFLEETKVVRAPGLRDTHIHCVFLILDPQRLDANIRAEGEQGNATNGQISKTSRIIGALDEDFDIQVLKTLQGKTTVIPVISKSDTVTTTRMAYLKRMVLESLRKAGIDPLEALNFEVEDSDDDLSDEDESEESEVEPEVKAEAESEVPPESNETLSTTEDTASSEPVEPEKAAAAKSKRFRTHRPQQSTSSISIDLLDKGLLPFSLLSPDEHSFGGGEGPIGRRFPWGFADPYNPEHCDFVKMREACFKQWRGDLREASREVFYERWRTSRLDRKAAPKVNSTPSPAPLIPRKSSGGIPIVLSGRKR